MSYDPQAHHRRSIRLPGYDYTSVGAYFVTLVAHERECLFGEVVDDGATCRVALNAWGEIAREEWFQTAIIRPYVVLYPDEFIVMPNHVHGIIWIVGDKRRGDPTGRPYPNPPGRPYPNPTGRPYPNPPGRPYDDGDRPCGPASGSVGAILAQYKSIVTKRINTLRGTPGAAVWQRNYYEHIIRDEDDLHRIREYIQNNPMRWAMDRENPAIVRV